MTKQYYLHDGTVLQGPFSFEVLQGKNISPEAHVWYEGLDEWTVARELEELNSLFSGPLAATPGDGSAVSPPDSMPVLPGQKETKRSLKVLLVVLLVAAIAATGLYYANRSATEASDTMQASYKEKIMTIEEIERSMPDDFLSVQGESKENFQNDKLQIRGVITNKATVAAYKDAIIRVTYYSKAMTELGSNEHTVVQHFAPNSTTPFAFNADNYPDTEAVGLTLVSGVAE